VLNTAKEVWPVKLLQLEIFPDGLLKWNLPGANSKNPIANIGKNGEVECWTQRKTFHPETKKGLEPDLRMSKTTPGRQDLIIIENKDRRKPRKSEMSEIIERYVSGTNAKLVCLINYDKFTSPTHNLSKTFQDREVQVYSEFKPLFVPKRFITSFIEIIGKEISISGSRPSINIPDRGINDSKINKKRSGYIIATLNWSKGPEDLDLHAWVKRADDNFHISYNNLGSKEKSPFAKLDNDARSLPGQETIFVDTDSLNSVIFAVHLYSAGSFSESDASINITFNDSRSVFFELPKVASGKWWHICTIDERANNLVVLNRVNDNEPNIL